MRSCALRRPAKLILVPGTIVCGDLQILEQRFVVPHAVARPSWRWNRRSRLRWRAAGRSRSTIPDRSCWVRPWKCRGIARSAPRRPCRRRHRRSGAPCRNRAALLRPARRRRRLTPSRPRLRRHSPALRRLLGFEDRFGGDPHHEDEDQRAQDRTGDLVPLPGIHKVTLRLAMGRMPGDITHGPSAVIAAKRRRIQGIQGFR